MPLGIGLPSLRAIMVVCFMALTVSFAGHALAQDKSITVASTASIKDSGLFARLLPRFTRKTGIGVVVLAVGTGQALDIGRRGDADVLFVHARNAEQQFVADGHGVKRYPVMYNDFVLVGPTSDPAGIGGQKDVVTALQAIRAKRQRLSRAGITRERTWPS
jgi:tungstate transport system substrate-binding protein